MNTSPLFKGCATALVTPFLPDGTLDEAALRRLIAMQLDSQVDALVLLGTTGEPCTLTMDERRRVIEIGLETTRGSLPIIVGTGSNNTHQAIEYARQAEQLGAQGQLCVTPYYNKATQAGLVRHYHAILESCPLPMIVYNVPSRTGVGMNADTLLRLSEHPLIVGIKEASGNPVLTAEILAQSQNPLHVYCGNDDQILPLMSLGACGAISVVSNVAPAQVHALTAALLKGDMPSARQTQLAMLNLIQALFLQVNPIPVKAALSMMGLIHDSLRLPLTPLEEPYREKLRLALQKMKLIP